MPTPVTLPSELEEEFENISEYLLPEVGEDCLLKSDVWDFIRKVYSQGYSAGCKTSEEASMKRVDCDGVGDNDGFYEMELPPSHL